MIGANDFCSDMCYRSSPWTTAENHRADLIETLRIIRDNLPRTLVNIIPPPNLKLLFDIRNAMPPICGITVDFECSCIFGLRWRHRHSEFYEIMARFEFFVISSSIYQILNYFIIFCGMIVNLFLDFSIWRKKLHNIRSSKEMVLQL